MKPRKPAYRSFTEMVASLNAMYGTTYQDETEAREEDAPKPNASTPFKQIAPTRHRNGHGATKRVRVKK